MYRTDFWILWEKARVGWSERIALKHVYYQVWNRSPAQVRCMRQVLGAGAPGWPRAMGWGGRWEGGSGWGTHVNPWLIHVNEWQKPLQYCKVISLQLIKINQKKKKRQLVLWTGSARQVGNKIICCLVSRLPWKEKAPYFGMVDNNRCRFFLTVSYTTQDVLSVGITSIFSAQRAKFAKSWATEVEKNDGILWLFAKSLWEFCGFRNFGENLQIYF